MKRGRSVKKELFGKGTWDLHLGCVHDLGDAQDGAASKAEKALVRRHTGVA